VVVSSFQRVVKARVLLDCGGMSSLAGRVGAIALLLLATACSKTGQDPGGECSYGGSVHPAGTTFPATDGCNTCACSETGEVACTKALCPADRGQFCSYGGRTYNTGNTFPSIDGCNSCVCLGDESVSCSTETCAVDGGTADGGAACALDADYDIGPIGGLVAYVTRAWLTSDGYFLYTEKGNATITELPASCTPALPGCGTPSAIDLDDLGADFADVDVRRAFKESSGMVFGRDMRPVDGQVLEIKRASGGTLLVGDECPITFSSCQPIPAGIAKLAADLRALIQQQIADASCSFARH